MGDNKKIPQISIFMENRSGRLAHITKALGKNQVNIRAMSLADTSDFGILRLIVNDTDAALSTLKTHGFTVNLSDVIAIRIKDAPGELGRILSIFEELDLNVEYMYAFVQKSLDHAVIIFRFENPDQAVTALLEKDVPVLDADEVLQI